MRMALRYPDIFSVAAASGGTYNNEPSEETPHCSKNLIR